MDLLLINDREVMLHGLKAILEAENDIRVIAEAFNEREALEKASETQPSVAILALDSDDANLNLCGDLYKISPETKILVLSSSEKDEQVIEFLKLGVSSYIIKDLMARDLVNAIRLVARGQMLMPSVTVHDLNKRLAARKDNYKGLTLREIEVLQGIASGLSNKEIACLLRVSEATVKTHISHIFKKLDVTNRTSAVLHAYSLNLITPNMEKPNPEIDSDPTYC